MTVFPYRPVWAGARCDPGPDGGQVTRIDLYSTPERDGTAVATAGPAVRIGEDRYEFTIPGDLADGRYWCTVTFIPREGAAPVTDRTVRLDAPFGTGLVASPEQLADELHVPLPLSATQRETFRTALEKAQGEVATYLQRPLVPVPKTLHQVAPTPFYALTDPRAWPVPDVDDAVKVVSYELGDDDAYTVRLLIGLDAAAETSIVHYVIAHAAERIRSGPGGEEMAGGGRRVSSVSAEGQSISYEAAPAAGQAGALPTLESLGTYRRRLWRPLPTAAASPWPYGGRRRFARW